MKSAILKHASRLPEAISLPLMRLNRSAQRVYGKDYWRHRRLLQQTQNGYDSSGDLFDCVNRALAVIPFYRSRYGSAQIRSIEQFEETFGFIDKDVILGDFESFINPGADLSRYDQGTTGGTSGKPLRLIAPKNRYVIEMATMHSLWGRAGYDFSPRAVIRNHKLGKNKKFEVNPITREVIFDGFRLEADYFEQVYNAIRRLGLRFIHCYPSTAYEFSTFLLDRGFDTSSIRAFLSGSENIFDYQVDLIQNRLGVRFYNWYGHSEKLILAGYCEHTNLYHVEPTYGYFELIDENNQPIREPGGFGEMVGTGFHNPGMVLIRYRTGDFAEYAGDYCPACKRRVTLLRNIKGRWSGDKLYNADGTFLTTTALNLHSNLYSVINGMQYVQDTMGIVRILIIKSPAYEAGHEAALYRHFLEKFKTGTEILIEYVDKLQKLPNGKFLHIISTVKV
jgi:phenylacetate-CoA ligase